MKELRFNYYKGDRLRIIMLGSEFDKKYGVGWSQVVMEDHQLECVNKYNHDVKEKTVTHSMLHDDE